MQQNEWQWAAYLRDIRLTFTRFLFNL